MGTSSKDFNNYCQSLAIPYMAPTPPLNYLSCGVPYQSLHSLNAFLSFSEKAIFFIDLGCAFLLTIGSFLLTVELFYLQLAILAFYLRLELFCLQL